MEDFGIIIPSYIHNEDSLCILALGLTNIRKVYPNTKIIVINDNSPYDFKNKIISNNIFIVDSEYPKKAEGLPYLYMYEHKPFKKAMILIDSFHIHKPIDNLDLINDFSFIKYALHHLKDWATIKEEQTEYNIKNNIITHDDKIKHYIKTNYPYDDDFYKFFNNIYDSKNKWVVCFGIMSVITYDFLIELNNKTNILHLFKQIKDRRDRMALESIFTIACLYTKKKSLNDIINSSCYNEWKLNIHNRVKINNSLIDAYTDNITTKYMLAR